MRESYRLRPLQMRISRHYGSGILRGDFVKRFDEFSHRRDKFVRFRPEVKPRVYRHLIVTAPRRMQALARLGKPFRKLALDEHVYVLRLRIDDELARSNFPENIFKRLDYRFRVLCGDYAAGSEHLRVSDTARDILFIHQPVDLYLPYVAIATNYCYFLFALSISAFTVIGSPKRLMKPAESF